MPSGRLDDESRSWWVRLHGAEPKRDQAIAELHERLRHEAHFHLWRRSRGLRAIRSGDLDDLASHAAADALLAVLRKLKDYRGESQFWTWARRFAQLEALVAIRQAVGHDQVANDPDRTFAVADPGRSPHERAVGRENLRRVTDSIVEELNPRQRRVLIAVAVDGVSPRELALELGTTPGAIYKTVHDARKKLTADLVVRGAT